MSRPLNPQWLVTHGWRKDRRFSTRARAESYVRKYGGAIQVVDLDPATGCEVAS